MTPSRHRLLAPTSRHRLPSNSHTPLHSLHHQHAVRSAPHKCSAHSLHAKPPFQLGTPCHVEHLSSNTRPPSAWLDMNIISGKHGASSFDNSTPMRPSHATPPFAAFLSFATNDRQPPTPRRHPANPIQGHLPHRLHPSFLSREKRRDHSSAADDDYLLAPSTTRSATTGYQPTPSLSTAPRPLNKHTHMLSSRHASPPPRSSRSKFRHHLRLLSTGGCRT